MVQSTFIRKTFGVASSDKLAIVRKEHRSRDRNCFRSRMAFAVAAAGGGKSISFRLSKHLNPLTRSSILRFLSRRAREFLSDLTLVL